jgi:hypothetical protein
VGSAQSLGGNHRSFLLEFGRGLEDSLVYQIPKLMYPPVDDKFSFAASEVIFTTRKFLPLAFRHLAKKE